METKVTADLTTMSNSKLIILIVGIIIGCSILMLVAAWIINKFKLVIGKGSIKVSDYEYDQNCQTAIYHLGEAIDTVDYETRNAIRRQTKASNYKIAKIGNIDLLCQTTRRSLFHAFKEPFYDYINANHFTRELRPDNFDSYRDNLLEIIHEQYQELMYEYKMDDCDRNQMDEWDLVSKQFEKLVDEWLLMVMTEVKKSCARKITLYEKVLPEVTNSKHWNGIVTECISKNDGYIKNISELIKNLTIKYKD